MNKWQYAVCNVPVIIGLLVVQCVFNQQISGIETTNGGTITAHQNSIVVTAPYGSNVFVSNDSYVPIADSGISHGSAIGSNDTISFSLLDTGNYTVYVSTAKRKESALIYNIEVGSFPVPITREYELLQDGTISGTVTCESDNHSSILVYIVGTSLYTVTSQNRVFTITNVPEGVHRLRAAILNESSSNQKPRLISSSNEKTVSIEAGATSQLDLSIP